MRKIISLVCLVGVIVLHSCNDDEDTRISTQQSSAVQDESTADAYFNDASDLSTTAYNSPTQSNLSGRTASEGKLVFTVTGDTRFNGATLTLDATGNLSLPQGTITIDFGTGVTGPGGTIRKGKILVAYSGYRFVTGSSYSITFDGYEVNGVKVQGKRTITTAAVTTASISFTVKDEDGKVTFSDGTFITRTSDHTRRWVFPTATAKSQWVVEGAASGITRDSKNYTLLISSGLVFKAECALNNIYIASEGEALLTVDGTAIKITYGAAGAACDKVVTIAVGSIVQDVTVN